MMKTKKAQTMKSKPSLIPSIRGLTVCHRRGKKAQRKKAGAGRKKVVQQVEDEESTDDDEEPKSVWLLPLI